MTLKGQKTHRKVNLIGQAESFYGSSAESVGATLDFYLVEIGACRLNW